MTLNPALLDLVKASKGKYARGVNAFKFKEGATTIRIHPAADGGKFWQDLGVHWIKQDLNGKPSAVVGCHEEVHGKPCAVCNAVASASGGVADDESLKVVSSWKAKRSVLVVATIRSGPDASENTAQVVEFTTGTFSDVLGVIQQYADHEINILDVNAGADLIVTRTGRGMNDTKYTVMPAPKSKPLSAAAIAAAPNLMEHIQREHFKGEDSKALNAISAFTGGSAAAFLPPAAAKRLTGPTATVAGAEVSDADTVTEIAEIIEAEEEAGVALPLLPTTPKTVTAPAAPAAKPAAVAAKPAAKPAAPAAAAAPAFGEPMSPGDIEDILGELDALAPSS